MISHLNRIYYSPLSFFISLSFTSTPRIIQPRHPLLPLQGKQLNNPCNFSNTTACCSAVAVVLSLASPTLTLTKHPSASVTSRSRGSVVPPHVSTSGVDSTGVDRLILLSTKRNLLASLHVSSSTSPMLTFRNTPSGRYGVPASMMAVVRLSASSA